MSPTKRAEYLFDQAKKLGMVNPATGDGMPSIAMVTEAIEDAQSSVRDQKDGDRIQTLIRAAQLEWEDDGPNVIRGFLRSDPETTLFLIRRSDTEPDHRGTMTGGVIPDAEDGKQTNENALLSWLKGIAAPMYLEDFQKRITGEPAHR